MRDNVAALSFFAVTQKAPVVDYERIDTAISTCRKVAKAPCPRRDLCFEGVGRDGKSYKDPGPGIKQSRDRGVYFLCGRIMTTFFKPIRSATVILSCSRMTGKSVFVY